LPDVAALIVLAILGAAVYAGTILALFGRRWLVGLWRGADIKSVSAPPAPD
jgi:hypothetical protein